MRREATGRQRREQERQEQARARGEGIRHVILAKLLENGGATVSDLVVFLPSEVPEIEIRFQLERLEEEGKTTADQGRYLPL